MDSLESVKSNVSMCSLDRDSDDYSVRAISSDQNFPDPASSEGVPVSIEHPMDTHNEGHPTQHQTEEQSITQNQPTEPSISHREVWVITPFQDTLQSLVRSLIVNYVCVRRSLSFFFW